MTVSKWNPIPTANINDAFIERPQMFPGKKIRTTSNKNGSLRHLAISKWLRLDEPRIGVNI